MKKIFMNILLICGLIIGMVNPLCGLSEVEPDGAFSYTIPLNLPPATGGIGPELSLAYNSESGNGLLGAGWNLQGFDTISRDSRYAVNLTDTGTGADHFLYMGQRLIKETYSNYYHTESESFLKIQMCFDGPSGNGHYWKVTDKNGVIRYYGSRNSFSTLVPGGGYIYANGTTAARLWVLDKVEDFNGNYYTIDYAQNTRITGSITRYGWYPVRMIYTINDKANAAYGSYRMVVFGYTGRTDSITDSKPTAVINDKLLSTIYVFTNVIFDSYWAVRYSNLHHYYSLTYDISDDTCNRNMLKEFREVSADDSLMKPALEFTYSPNHVVNVTNTGNRSMVFSRFYSTVKKENFITAADFDGDGKDDIMDYMGLMYDTDYMLRITPSRPGAENGGLPQGQSCYINGGANWKVKKLGAGKVASTILFGDFNGDNRMDFMTYQGETSLYSKQQKFKLFLSVTSSKSVSYTSKDVVFNNIGIMANSVCDSSLVRICDVNGDGKTSFLVAHSQHTLGWDRDFYELFKPASVTRANLLTSIYNGQGGTTTITYVPATAYVNADSSLTVIDQSRAVINSCLPHTGLRNLTANVSIHSGVDTYAPTGNGSTIVGSTDYSYVNGMFYPGKQFERCLSGFQMIETRDSYTYCSTRTYYSQDRITNRNPGSIIKVETYGFSGTDGNNKDIMSLMTKNETAYACRELDEDNYPEVYFTYKTADYLTNYDAAGNSLVYWTSYSYDEYGNNTIISNYGNPTTTADDMSTVSYFAVLKDRNLMKIWKTETYGYSATGVWDLATQSIKFFSDQPFTFTGTNPQQTRDNLFFDIAKTRITQVCAKGGGGADPDTYTSFEYDIWGNCTKITDGSGNVTRKVYDSNYHMLVTDTYTDPTGLNLHTHYEYDNFMNNTGITDTNNVVVSRTYYNALHEPDRILGPNDTYTSPAVQYFYDYAGKTVDPATKYIIGNPRYVKTQTKVYKSGTASNEQYGYQETYIYYNGAGQPVQIFTNASETSGYAWQVTTTVYDKAGRVAYTTVPRESTSNIDFSYVFAGNYPKTTCEYDYAGRLVKTLYPDTTFTQIKFGLTCTGILDRNGHYTETETAGNIKTAKEYTGTYFDINGGFTEYARTVTKEYRGGSTVTDANGNVTTTVLNMLGRTRKIISPDMGTWSFEYDANGNKTGQTDGRNNTIHYTYDKANRLNTITYPDNTQTVFIYDETGAAHGCGKGRLTTSIYPAGSISTKYDNAGNVTEQATTIDGMSRTESFTYAQTNALITRTYPGNSGTAETLTYTYQNDGNLKNVSSSLGLNYLSGMSYNIRNQLTGATRGNGRSSSYYSYYDEHFRDAYAGGNYNTYRLRYESSGVLGMYYSYNYDRAGNLRVRSDESSTNGSAIYVYDEMDRLTSATTALYGSFTCDYDKVGNMTGKNGTTMSYTEGTNRLAFDGVNYYQYDGNGNIISKSPNEETAARQIRIGGSTYNTLQGAHEAARAGQTIMATANVYAGDITPTSTTAGNVTFSGGWNAAFTSVIGTSILAGQITAATQPLNFQNFILAATGGYAGYTYDYNNMLIKSGSDTYTYFGERRVKKVENGIITRYFFGDYEEETNGSVNYIKYYPGGAQRSTTDGLLIVYKDISGNSSVITDASGNPVKKYIYDPFGELITDNPYVKPDSTRDVKYKFAGGERDATGLSYFGACYYDPTICRFITADSIVPGGSPQCLNRYSYCANNPVNYADLSGHSFLSDLGDSLGDAVGDFINGVTGLGDSVTKPLLKYAMLPLEELGIKEVHYGTWIGLGGELSINCETGDYSANVGYGLGQSGGFRTSYADIGGDCSTHVGLGYNSADKSFYFKASTSASFMNTGNGANMVIGYSFRNHMGYQSAEITTGPLSYGWSMNGRDFDVHGNLNFAGLSGSWSYKDGFSLGASLSSQDGNSLGVSYNVKNGKWRGSVGLAMCFVAGTKVETIDGYRNIEEIKTGDLVKSYNEQTGEFGYKPVVATIVTHPEKLIRISIQNETLECTMVHLFYVVSGPEKDTKTAGWVNAGDLRPGMKLLSSDGTIRIVYDIEIICRNDTTYNFEVADWHTYCVGKNRVVVHNEAGGVCYQTEKGSNRDKTERAALSYLMAKGMSYVQAIRFLCVEKYDEDFGAVGPGRYSIYVDPDSILGRHGLEHDYAGQVEGNYKYADAPDKSSNPLMGHVSGIMSQIKGKIHEINASIVTAIKNAYGVH